MHVLIVLLHDDAHNQICTIYRKQLLMAQSKKDSDVHQQGEVARRPLARGHVMPWCSMCACVHWLDTHRQNTIAGSTSRLGWEVLVAYIIPYMPSPLLVQHRIGKLAHSALIFAWMVINRLQKI